MSFLCRMVIGYFDPNQVQPHELVRHLVSDRLLDSEQVAQLQSACTTSSVGSRLEATYRNRHRAVARRSSVDIARAA